MKILCNFNFSLINVVFDIIFVIVGEICGMFVEFGNVEDCGRDIQFWYIWIIVLVIGAFIIVGYLSYWYFGLFQFN